MRIDAQLAFGEMPPAIAKRTSSERLRARVFFQDARTMDLDAAGLIPNSYAIDFFCLPPTRRCMT